MDPDLLRAIVLRMFSAMKPPGLSNTLATGLSAVAIVGCVILAVCLLAAGDNAFQQPLN